MDTLAKETMGLPIFICSTNHQIISSGNTTTSTSSTSVMRSTNTDSAAASPPTSPTSAQYSPTTSFFASATATRSPTTQTFAPASDISTNRDPATSRDTRRNTYTPPTFSPPTRRESLLSTHRLSAAFDFASTFAVEVLSKAADQVFGNEEGRTAEAGMHVWGEDLEAGGREREGREKGGYSRFGEEGAFESWLD